MPLLLLGLVITSAIAGASAVEERNKRLADAAAYRAHLAAIEEQLAAARWREQVLRRTADDQNTKLHACLVEIRQLRQLQLDVTRMLQILRVDLPIA